MIILEKIYFDPNTDLERYEDFDDKRISKMTDNQMQMALDDERSKAKRNASKLVSERSKEGRIEGEKTGYESGRNTGKKIGAVAGGLYGLSKGLLHSSDLSVPLSKGKKGLLTAGLTVGGAAAGYGLGKWIGGKIGKSSGGKEGQRRGAQRGREEAKRLGHDEIEVTTKNARKFDDYARKHKKEDKWETGFRKKLADEKEAEKREAERRRQEQLERRRVQAEERKAYAEHRRANTDRYRFLNEISRENNSGYYGGWYYD